MASYYGQPTQGFEDIGSAYWAENPIRHPINAIGAAARQVGRQVGLGARIAGEVMAPVASGVLGEQYARNLAGGSAARPRIATGYGPRAAVRVAYPERPGVVRTPRPNSDPLATARAAAANNGYGVPYMVPADAAPGAYRPGPGGMRPMDLPQGREIMRPQINQDFVDRARQRVLAAGANNFQSAASKAEAMRVGGIQSATMDARASGMNKTGQAKYLAERKRMQDFESQAPERAAKRQADIEMERAKAPQAKTQSGPTSPGEMIKNTLARLNNIQMGGNPQAAAAYNSAIVGLSEEDGARLAELLSIDPATAPPDQVEIRKRALANYKLMREKMGQRYDPILDSLVI